MAACYGQEQRGSCLFLSHTSLNKLCDWSNPPRFQAPPGSPSRGLSEGGPISWQEATLALCSCPSSPCAMLKGWCCAECVRRPTLRATGCSRLVGPNFLFLDTDTVLEPGRPPVLCFAPEYYLASSSPFPSHLSDLHTVNFSNC